MRLHVSLHHFYVFIDHCLLRIATIAVRGWVVYRDEMIETPPRCNLIYGSLSQIYNLVQN